MTDPGFIDVDGVPIAYCAQPGRGPTTMFLPGYASDMAGTKAAHLAARCGARGTGFVRFDYAGHGVSGGAFDQGTIGRWLGDALAVIDQVTAGPLILVGSSMGGWIALLAALARPARVTGLVLVAPAPDFTEDLIWPSLPEVARDLLLRQGFLERPGEYGAPLRLTLRLIEDGRAHLLLRGPIAIAAPVRILHGQRDTAVPWERSVTLAARLAGDDVRLTLIKDGDHRLSRGGDLALLGREVEELHDAARMAASPSR